MKTRRVMLKVVAVDTDGHESPYHLLRHVPRSVQLVDEVEALYAAHKFQAASGDGTVDVTVTEITWVRILPDRHYFSLKNNVIVGAVTKRFIGYDDDFGRMSYEMYEGEGVSFNDYPRHWYHWYQEQRGGDYIIRRTRNAYQLVNEYVTWELPREQWEYHERALDDVNYLDASEYTSDMPETWPVIDPPLFG